MHRWDALEVIGRPLLVNALLNAAAMVTVVLIIGNSVMRRQRQEHRHVLERLCAHRWDAQEVIGGRRLVNVPLRVAATAIAAPIMCNAVIRNRRQCPRQFLNGCRFPRQALEDRT